MDIYVKPDQIVVSSEVIALARAFIESARAARQGIDWVAVFEWADDWRFRDKGTNDWTDVGPGVHLVARERNEIPPSAATTIDGLTYAIAVPAHIIETYRASEIVIDQKSYFKVRLK